MLSGNSPACSSWHEEKVRGQQKITQSGQPSFQDIDLEPVGGDTLPGGGTEESSNEGIRATGSVSGDNM